MEEKYNRLIEIFKELSKVPRNSKQEEKIGEYILNFARSLGLDANMDKMYNVVVKRKAALGKENSKKIIFQAHTDMVCEKREGSIHDFEKDQIEIIEEEGTLKAKDTTLGADDGIGVALLLLLMENSTIKLPETYFIFTTQEEIGMNGARALDYTDICADYLINLDGEEENTAIVGCAGGVSVHYDKKVDIEEVTQNVYELKIYDLLGGHSGVDINKGRINSNYLAAKILENANTKIISFNGGNKDNAIPNYTKVVFSSNEEISKLFLPIGDFEIPENDENAKISLEELKEDKYYAMSEEESRRLVSFILNLKQGVIAMSKDKDDLVETSGNIGIVRVEEGRMHIVESLRSSIDERKEEVKEYNNTLAKKEGFEILEEGAYPGWKYNPNSVLQEVYKKAYMKTHKGVEPLICAIHAGVECGMIYEKMPNLDMISLGPDVVDVHTVNEKLKLDSCRYLLQTLLDMIDNLG